MEQMRSSGLEIKDWQDLGECRDSQVDFFAIDEAMIDEEMIDEEMVEKAQELCRVCVVEEECLQFAIETRQTLGIWGGFDRTGRQNYKRRLARERRRNND